jgi:hypothetical protein
MGFLGDIWSGISSLGSKINQGLGWLGDKVIKPVAHYTGLEYLAKPISYVLDKTAEAGRWLGHNTIGDTATALLETGWGFTPWGATLNAGSAISGVLSDRRDLGLGTILDGIGGAGKIGKLAKSGANLIKGTRGVSAISKTAEGASRIGSTLASINRATQPVQRYVRGMSTYARQQVQNASRYASGLQARAVAKVQDKIIDPLLKTKAGQLYTKADDAYRPYKPYVDNINKAKGKFSKAYQAQRTMVTRGAGVGTNNETFNTDERPVQAPRQPSPQSVMYRPPTRPTANPNAMMRVRPTLDSQYQYNIPKSAIPRVMAY